MQEIGPRFTLKLRWVKKNIPAVRNFGEAPKPLEFDTEEGVEEPQKQMVATVIPPREDEYIWQWKVNFSQTRLTTLAHSPISPSLRPRGAHSSCDIK